LLGAEIERLSASRPDLVRRTLAGTAALLGVAVAVLVGEFGFNVIPNAAGRWVPLARTELQARDWTELRAALAERGMLVPGLVLGGVGWQETGKIDYAMGGAAPVICLNPDTRQYAYAPGITAHLGEDILIASTRPVTAEMLARQGVAFDTLQSLPPVELLPERPPGVELRLTLGRKLRVAGVDQLAGHPDTTHVGAAGGVNDALQPALPRVAGDKP
jgi:hypothetical protein